MKKHPESHLDHELTTDQVTYLFERFADRSTFFIETFELPVELGKVPCYLYGPAMGDLPVPESEVRYYPRGARTWSTRSITHDSRPTRIVTVIAGPHEEHACILYTAFGGPPAPREPAEIRKQLEEVERQRRELSWRWQTSAPGAVHPEQDPNFQALTAQIEGLREKRTESDAFWSQHALGCSPMAKLG